MGFDRTSFLKAADAAVGPLLCRLLGAGATRRAKPMPPRVPDPATLRRLLVLRPGGMGDMIVLLPVLKRLRERLPAAGIDVVCERRNAAVLQLAGLGARPLLYDAQPLVFLRTLRRTRYDVALDSEQFHNFSAVIASLSRAPMRVGFNINPRRNGLYTHLVSYDPGGREPAQFGRLLGPLGLNDALPAADGILSGAELPPPPVRPAALADILAAGRFVAIHAGASTPYKAWPGTRFADLTTLLAKRQGCDVVLVGGAADAERSRHIAAATALAGVRSVSCAGQLGLGETATVLRRARAFVGADSGLAHLAAALGTPTVTLFGPSDPDKWAAEGPRHAVVRQPLSCSPCFIFGYHKPCRHVACMEAITVAAVMEACERVIDEPVSGS